MKKPNIEVLALEALIEIKAGSVLLAIKAGKIPGVIWVGDKKEVCPFCKAVHDNLGDRYGCPNCNGEGLG